MSRRRRPLPVLEQLEIIDAGAEGKSIARYNEQIVFVNKAIPGDVVDVKITKKQKNFMEGYPLKFHKYAEDRITPRCSHFGSCGGCKWQMMPYTKQLKYKQQQVVDALERIGRVELPEIKPIIASENDFYYRNKLEFTFSTSRWLTQDEIDTENPIKDMRSLGFHVPRLFDKIVNIEHCYLQGSISNDLRNSIRTYALENDLSFYNIRRHEGLLRTLIIRTTSTNQNMVIVVFGEEDAEKRIALLTFLQDKFPELTALMYVINTKKNDTINDLEVHTFGGQDFIVEEMEGLQFRIGAKSFYQTNSQQAYQLYKVAREFAQLTGDETVYDLYTGTGTIANFVARQSKKVIGIEYIPEAIADAQENARLNSIDNTAFFAGDMKDVLTEEFITKNGKPDVIILDPPRAGMHPGVVKMLLETRAPRIVYVSCNPATQARDLNMLDELYSVKAVQPVDMFPQTHHVENVVMLELKK